MPEPFFRDRSHAGRLLALQLEEYAYRTDAMVLALPRGGVPVGFEIARALQLPLDVLLVRKLGTPGFEEVAMGAVTGDGRVVLRQDILAAAGAQAKAIEEAMRRELRTLREREATYHQDRPLLQPQGHTVILVDDGLATGSSMLAAIRALRSLQPARIVVAVPVGAPDACERVATEADRLVCLQAPDAFRAVSLWYGEFDQTSDDEVRALLRQAAQQHASDHGPDSDTPIPDAQGTIDANRHHQG